MNTPRYPFAISAALCAVALLCPAATKADWHLPLDLTRAAAGISGGAIGMSDNLVDASNAKPKRQNKKRNRGTFFKKPDYKIKAPKKSEADRLKENGSLLDYLDGTGLSPQTPLGGKNSAASGTNKPLKK